VTTRTSTGSHGSDDPKLHLSVRRLPVPVGRGGGIEDLSMMLRAIYEVSGVERTKITGPIIPLDTQKTGR
jgi:hypothetical protein